MAENSNGQLRDGSNSAHLESPDSVPRPTLRPGNESITSYLVPVRWARTVELFDGWVDLKRCKVLRVGRWWALYRTPLGGFLEYVYIPSIPEYAYFVGKARASRWFKFNPELAPAELWPYLGMVDLTEAPIDFIDAPADQPELVADAAPSGNGTAATNGRAPEAPAEPPDLVRLDQAAAAAHKSKRTLERHKTEGTLPEPVVEGGGGRHALYDWKVMRPWLTKTFGVILPERFPANLR